MILEKSLQPFAIEGPGHVLTRVRVKPDGLNVDGGCLAGGTEELMRLKEVERAIGSTGGTVSELIERGYLRATTERRETGRIVKFVVRQSFLELDRKYISLSAISKSRQGFRARSRRSSTHWILRRFTSRSVSTPAFTIGQSLREVGSVFRKSVASDGNSPPSKRAFSCLDPEDDQIKISGMTILFGRLKNFLIFSMGEIQRWTNQSSVITNRFVRHLIASL